MSSSAYERAKNNNDQHFNMTGDNSGLYALARLGNFVMPAVQHVSEDMMHLHMNIHDEAVNIVPSPSPAASVFRTTGAYTDFDIERQELIPSGVTLRYRLTNTDGANTITLIPAELQIERVEFFANRSTLVSTWYGDQMFARANLHNQWDQRSARSVISNTNTTTFSGAAAIAASGTADYDVEIPGMWDAIDMSLAWCDSWRVRVYWNGADSKSAGVAAITSVDVSNVSLIIAEKQMPRAQAAKLHMMPKASPGGLLVQAVDSQHMQLNPTYTNSETVSHSLDSFRGKATELLVIARTAISGAPLAAASDVYETIELRDANNKNLKSHPTNARHLRESVLPRHYPSDFCRVTNYNLITAVPGGQMAVEHAHYSTIGYEHLDRNILRVVTGAAAAGTYYVDMYATIYTLINFSPTGRCIVKPSQ